jgi:LysM repeat protein
MIAGAMVGWRNPARYLAPLALAAAAAATYTIVHSAVTHKHTTSAPLVAPAAIRPSTSRTRSARAKFYVVQPNDTLSRISARTGVPLATIEALNPSVNPDALHPSQRLRLRR